MLHFSVHNIIEKLAISGKLHDDIYPRSGFDDFIHLGNGRVSCDFEDMKLS